MQRGVLGKKGQGLPITTIIIAILGIAVLVILFAILTGRLTIFTAAVSECPGTCVVSDLQGVSDRRGVYEARDGCVGDERELFGVHIARVRKQPKTGQKVGDPISCKACCISAV